MAETIEQKFDVDISALLANLDKVDNRLGGIESKFKEVAKVDPFKDAARSAADLDAQATKNTSNTVRQAKTREQVIALLRKEEAAKRALIAREREFIAAAKYDKYQRDLKKVNAEIDRLNLKLGKTPGFASKFGNAIGNLSGGLLTSTTALLAGLGAGLLAIGKRAFDAQSSYQGFQAQLTVGLGSQELANENLSVLERLAAKLPQSLEGLTSSYAQLVNRGFKPTVEQITNLSGLAASQNKSFSQLNEAILDAEQGELERLKEFGIQARNEGNKVIVSFNGVTKSFVKGARESAAAFSEMSKELGLDKLNLAKMQTLEGRLSNLGDQTDRIFRLLGKALLPVFEALFDVIEYGLGFVDDAITGFTTMGDELDKTKGTIDEQVYPAFDRFFKLFSPSSEGRSWISEFFVNLRGEWEITKNQISLVISELEYYFKLFRAYATLTPNSENMGSALAAGAQLEQDRAQYRLNLERIRKEREDALTKLDEPKKDGELTYAQRAAAAAAAAADKKALEAAKKLAEDKKKALLKAMKDQEGELKKQRDTYDQEKLEALKNDEEAYLEAKYQYALKEIAIEEAYYLKLKQLAEGAKKGKFDKDLNPIADTSVKLSIEEEGVFADRRNSATNSRNLAKAELEVGRQKEITKELSDEYQRQLQDVEDKYAELFKVAEKDEDALAKLRIRKQEETNRILLQKELDRLNDPEKRQLLAAEIELYDAQAQGRIDLELQATRKLLEIEKDFMQQKLALLLNSGLDVNDPQVVDAIAGIAQVDAELAKVDISTKKATKGFKGLFLKLGGNDEGFEAFQQFAGEFQNVLQDLFQIQMEISQRKVDAINKEIDAKRGQIEEEKRLNEQGLANNLDLRNKELAQLEKNREKALKSQQKLVRAQLVADTAAQASSMATAVANLFANESKLGVLGLALAAGGIGVMFAAFLAAKIKAFQASKQAPLFEKGGPVLGKRHSEGGTMIEAEHGEYVTNRGATAKYRDLIEAINEDDSATIRRESLKQLVKGTGVGFNDEARKETTVFIQNYGQQMAGQSVNQDKLLMEIIARLDSIDGHTDKIPKSQMVSIGENKVMTVEGHKTTIREIAV